ncbi:TRP-domain-containing protein [Teratosphaeria nubilosa]|uniref:TRP-domain-containing protein n=1 Tax=Teratosphaeria nubilosa TaxID=161662 RepID=A0A6G1LNJ0_9PEZI|nr:TRP-domain-containing protein [Teratosphaeria nubilosa]
MPPASGFRGLLSLAILSALPAGVLGGDVLSSTGYTSCQTNATVQVTALNVTYHRNTRVIVFDVAGYSTRVQNVTADLVVTAYGEQVYTKSFDPCDSQYNLTQICPIPADSFSARGVQTVPEEYASQIPSIAYSIPDLDGDVKMTLKEKGTNDAVACVESTVGNGNTLQTPAVKYVGVGVAAAALGFSVVSAVAAGGHPGASTSSPTFGEVIGWFQGMAMNGMLSVNYPRVYRSFTTNFAFSTGLISWGSMQTAIDNFRKSTGGNLTDDSSTYLKNNATLVYSDGTDSSSTSSNTKRALDTTLLWARDSTVNVGDSSSNSSASSNSTKMDHIVSGIQAYTEQLTIPSGNAFMTILLIFFCIVGVIIVFILLLKVILEAWSMFGNIPKSMESWRQRYWWRLAKALTNLILLAYGTWTMYCIYQWTDGDSWAAKVLAGVTFAAFTAVLIWFTWVIFKKAHEFKKMGGDASGLYEDKETWVKYNLFYENFKRGYWWIFVPAIVYAFARGAIIAIANGHGFVQAGGQIIVEGIFLILLLWKRPYQRKSGNWINIFIQVVRVLSVVCVLVFVEELGISQTTKTVTGIVLIVVQCVLTAALAILIGVNALITCIRENPHRKARKAQAKMSCDLDNLTPLDARNSLFMESMAQKGGSIYTTPIVAAAPFGDQKGRYNPVPLRPDSPADIGVQRSYSRQPRSRGDEDRERLVSDAASMGHRAERSVSRDRSPDEREPQLPDVGYGRAY